MSLSHPAHFFALFAVTLLVVTAPEAIADEKAAHQSFDTQFAANLKAAKTHFWDAIDCQRRDEMNGLPTTQYPLPWATRMYVDAAEYNAVFVFPPKAAKMADVHQFVRARVKANLPKGFEYLASDTSSAVQVQHKTDPEAHVTASLMMQRDHLMLIIYPPSRAELPFGNPCAQPKKPGVK